MSDLRKHLEALRGEHLSAEYPGDLAADTARTKQSERRIGTQILTGAAAIAALVAIVIWVNRSPVVMEQAAVDPPVSEREPTALATFPALTVPMPPEDASFAIEAPKLHCAMPAFPSLFDLLNLESEKESI